MGSDVFGKQTFYVPNDLFETVAGTGGERVHGISVATGATISEKGLHGDDGKEIVISIIGTPENIQAALAMFSSLLGTRRALDYWGSH